MVTNDTPTPLSAETLTPEYILALYQQYGVEPRPRVFLAGREGAYCGCPVGVLILDQYGAPDPIHIVHPSLASLDAVLGQSFRLGLEHGFDTYFERNPPSVVATEQFRRGSAVGYAAAKLICDWWSAPVQRAARRERQRRYFLE